MIRDDTFEREQKDISSYEWYDFGFMYVIMECTKM